MQGAQKSTCEGNCERLPAAAEATSGQDAEALSPRKARGGERQPLPRDQGACDRRERQQKKTKVLTEELG